MKSTRTTLWLGLLLASTTSVSHADPIKSIFDENWTPTSQPTAPKPPAPAEVAPPPTLPTAPTTQAVPEAPVIPVSAAPMTIPRWNPPSLQIQAETLKLVREIFEDEYRATTPAAHQQLAERLLTEAQAIRQNQTARYVLLHEAVEASVLAGDPDLCQRALDGLSGSFNADNLQIGEDAVLRMLSKPSTARSLAGWAAAVAEQAIDHNQADMARRIIGLTLPRAANDGQVIARLKSVQASIVEYDKLQVFTKRLMTDPNDPAARLAVGKYIITKKGDWQVGLQHLAKGSDAKLRDLAARDMANTVKADLQFELASQWWAQGKQEDKFRADCEARAVHWYALAEPGLTDLKKVLARKRIAEAAPLRRLPASVAHVVPVSLPPGNGIPVATGVKIAAAMPVALNEMFDKCLQGDATAFDRLQIMFGRTKLKPKTTLEAQRVTGTLSLNAAGSPYAVTGFLLIEKEATLVIEPGTLVLFAPDIKIQNQGTLRVVSDGAWSVLAGADPATRWKGIDSTGKIELRRCLVTGADFAFGMHDSRDSLSANECIFAANGETVGAGNGGHAVVKNSLFLRNELGPFGHGDDGKVEFLQCLLLFNRRGCSANFYGRTEGSSSTFFGNQTAIEAADVGDGVRISLCNIITANGVPLGTRGGKAIVSGNYWGSKGPPTDAKHDTSSALSAPVKDSLPALGNCEYLKGVEVSAASPAPSANPNAAGAVPFLTFADAVGTWKEKSGEKSGGDMVLSKNGRLLYAGRQPGTWALTADTLVLTWDKGRVDTYNTREGDTISGQSTIGHKVSITKTSR